MSEDTAAPKTWWSPSRRAVFAEVFPLRPQGSKGIFPLVPYYRDQDGKLPEDAVELVQDEVAAALLEANETLGEAQCQIAMAAGLLASSSAFQIVARVKELAATPPAPTGSDTAAVLAGLVSEMRKEQDNNWGEPVTIGLRHAIALVEAAQAATGARAAGGEIPWTAQSEALLPYVGSEDADTCREQCTAIYPPNPRPEDGYACCLLEQGHEQHQRNDGFRWSPDPHHGYTCAENETLTDGLQGDVNTVSDVLRRAGHKVDLREHGIDHWVWEALEKPAAPPTPSAHGVAELLALCARGIEAEGRHGAVVACTLIQRLLAPEGGQS